MSPRTPVLLLLLVSAFCLPCWSQEEDDLAAAAVLGPVGPAPTARPPPFDPWDGKDYPPPTSPSPESQPAPGIGRAERARRPVEVVPEVGPVVPLCREGTLSNERCRGIRASAHAGFSALWRVHPYFAWGGSLDFGALTYDPPAGLTSDDPEASALFLGAVGRVYGLEKGVLDPYLQLGLGLGAVRRSFVAPTGDRIEETGAGPALQTGVGVDAFVSSRLRVGPAVTFTRTLIAEIRHCNTSRGDACVELDPSDDGHVHATFEVSVRLTVMLGTPM